MSLISVPYIFASGNTIIASQHNLNFSTIVNDYDGNIDNTNISNTAAIANSKLNLASISQNVIVAGSLTTNGSLTTSGNVIIGSEHQGDVLYDNGTTLSRLTPGTSGQFLQTQGTSANPIWTSINIFSNVLFQYQGCVDVEGATSGELLTTTLTPSTGTANYRFFAAVPGGTLILVWSSKFQKISGINTVTIYTRVWGQISTVNPGLSVTIGGHTGSANAGTSMTSPTWITFTIDVSALTNNTFYDVTASLKDAAAIGNFVYCANIIGFGS